MSHSVSDHKLISVALFLVLWAAVPAARADEGGLEPLVGRWDARVKTLQPEPGELTYTETYEWVLGHKFLKGRTENKSDGTEDVVYGTYDSNAKGYPFWIFSSSGAYLYLAPGSWNSRTRTMEWKSPANSDIWYHTKVVFPGDGTRHWTVIVKDWKGKLVLHQEGRAVRRDDSSSATPR